MSPVPVVVVRHAVRTELVAVPAEDLVLVACSGGPDSVALALAARLERFRVGAIVVDHGLQPNSRLTADRVGELLRAQGLDPVQVVSVAVVENGDGMESAARDARYAALAAEAEKLGSSVVLLGHTLDDQAETVLLGLARGSGVQSLAGMPRRRGIYRRPLLDLPRATVHASVPSDVPLVDDVHNHDERYTRVRVRRNVLPFLESELGPGVIAALARTAALTRADAEVLAELTEQAAKTFDVDAEHLDVSKLSCQPLAIRSRIIRTWLSSQGVPLGKLSATHSQRLEALVSSYKGQGAVALPGRLEVFRVSGRLVVRTRHGG